MSIRDDDEVFALWSRCDGVGLAEGDSRDDIRAFLRRNPGLSFVATSGKKDRRRSPVAPRRATGIPPSPRGRGRSPTVRCGKGTGAALPRKPGRAGDSEMPHRRLHPQPQRASLLAANRLGGTRRTADDVQAHPLKSPVARSRPSSSQNEPNVNFLRNVPRALRHCGNCGIETHPS